MMAARLANAGESPTRGEASQSIADYLPLNLRSILNHGMFSSTRTDERTINRIAGRGPSEATLREFARAVRSFAATRAREHWIECGVSIRELELVIAIGPCGERSSFICLKCAVLAPPAELQLHPEPACILAPLEASSARLSAPERARRAVEKFRAKREADGLPHYDLDCYVSKGRMVFTWRPPAGPALGH
jgi:hypothetical protein